MAAFEASWSEGITSAARFYAPDVEVDERGLSGYEGAKAGFIQSTRDMAQPVPRWLDGADTADAFLVTGVEPLYLSTTGAIHPIDTKVPGWPVFPLARQYAIGADGITQEAFTGSAKSGEALGGIPMNVTEPIVRGYLRGWASGDPDAVRERYAKDAVLVDSIGGVEATGSTAVATVASSAADAGGLQGASLRTLPADQGPAWYANGPYLKGEADMLVLLLDLPGQCPGPVAVQLRLDKAGRILREDRYRRIDALRHCLAADQRPHGWWETVTLPDAPPVLRTGTVRVGTREIAVWNGSGWHEGLLRWALQRFADAGLPGQYPSSVTFLPEVPNPWETYGFVTGSNAADIGVSVPEPYLRAEPDGGWSATAKHAMLHELAHLWLTPSPYYGPPERAPAVSGLNRWARAQGLTWDDPNLPWEQRAGERAAEIVAWGLMDEPDRLDPRVGEPTCAQLVQDFQALTQTTPDSRACATGVLLDPGGPA